MRPLKKLYEKIKIAIINSTTFFKLVVFTIFMSTLPLIFISIMLDSKMEQVIGNELSASYEQIANQYVSSIKYKTDIYQTLVTNAASNLSIINLLANKDTQTSNEIYDTDKRISKELGLLLGANNISELDNLMIYSFDEKKPIYGLKISNVLAVKDEEWYKNMLKEKKFNNYFFYRKTGTKKNVFSITKVIANTNSGNYGEKIGFVKLDVDASSFFGDIPNISKEQKANTYIVNNNGKVLFSAGEKNKNEMSEAELENIMASQKDIIYTKVQGEKAIIVCKDISQYGWKALFVFHYGEIEKKGNDVRRTIMSFAVITIIIVLFFTILFSTKFSKRIKILLSKMEKVQNGNMEITEKIEGNDEIGILDSGFNKMVLELKELINNNYIQKLEKRQAQLNALQLQINPHFLYNTLEIINSMAAIKKCYEICEVCQKLGDMFRYSINTGKSEFTTFEKELKHIENYIYIQKIRFPDKIEVFFNVDDEVKNYKVLRFILQPILENVILHGFKDNEKKGTIEIGAYKEEDKLIIKIEDDGRGMTEERVEEVNNYINYRDENVLKSYRKSIGIRNVNMRIKLSSGDNYGILIKSKLDVGTQVVLTLPLNDDEEES